MIKYSVDCMWPNWKTRTVVVWAWNSRLAAEEAMKQVGDAIGATIVESDEDVYGTPTFQSSSGMFMAVLPYKPFLKL